MKKILSVFGILLAILLTIYFSVINDLVISYVRNRHTIDGSVRPDKIVMFSFTFAFGIILLILLSLATIFDVYKRFIKKLLNKHIDLNKFQEDFLDDNLLKRRSLSKIVIYTSMIYVVVYQLYYFFFTKVNKEGAIENFSEILILISAIFLFISSRLTNKVVLENIKIHWIKYTCISFSIILLLIFGEEISWGQHYFQWESTGVFENNFQKETNAHNFFNPIFYLIYPILGMGLLLTCIMIEYVKTNERLSFLLSLFVPHTSLYLLVFMIACSSFYYHEGFEFTLSIFLFFYSLRILVAINDLKNNSLRLER